MLVLDIQPYIGALPLRLGMSRQEVHALLGSPWRSMPGRNHTGSSDYWLQAKINVGLTRDGIVNHIGLSPGSYVLSVQGQVLWSSKAHPDPNPALLRLDPRPVTTLGFLVFTALGITTTGFHDDDPSQRALTVFPLGAWDKYLPGATTPDLRRYDLR